MSKELTILENKARFVEEVCKGELVVSNRKRKELLHDLNERGYNLFPKDGKKESEDGDDEDETVEENASDAELSKGYEYLLGMKVCRICLFNSIIVCVLIYLTKTIYSNRHIIDLESYI